MATRSNNLEYLRRYFAWNVAKITHYQVFPWRKIDNAPPAFRFEHKPEPGLFDPLTFTLGGQTRQLGLVEFLEFSKTTALVVIQDGAIRCEAYGSGYTRESINTSFSMAKSFASTLIGLAIHEGRIGSVSDPVIHYLPELAGRGLDALTIRHLLTMSTGIHYRGEKFVGVFNSPWDDDPKTYFYPDLRTLALGVRAGDIPVGHGFLYNNYHPLLLGMIIERTTGMSVSEYLQERIWKRLGMEWPASWSLDSEGGFEKMESGLNARAIDFAKFGWLFLSQGRWNGQQVVPEQWVTEATTPDPLDNRPWFRRREARPPGVYYKYMWWGQTFDNGDYAFMAEGNLGQYIWVYPRQRVVIVRNGWQYGPIGSWGWPQLFADLAGRL